MACPVPVEPEVTRKIENFIPRCGPRTPPIVLHLHKALAVADGRFRGAIRKLLNRIERKAAA